MENNKENHALSCIVSHDISWPILAALGGLCLTGYSSAEVVIKGDPETLAEEIATQISAQARRHGQDPMHTKEEISIRFSVPVWAVIFIVSIVDKTPSSRLFASHIAPFARKALDIIEAGEADPDELPGFRLN